jgi:hypothetical protein
MCRQSARVLSLGGLKESAGKLEAQRTQNQPSEESSGKLQLQQEGKSGGLQYS